MHYGARQSCLPLPLTVASPELHSLAMLCRAEPNINSKPNKPSNHCITSHTDTFAKVFKGSLLLNAAVIHANLLTHLNLPSLSAFFLLRTLNTLCDRIFQLNQELQMPVFQRKRPADPEQLGNCVNRIPTKESSLKQYRVPHPSSSTLKNSKVHLKRKMLFITLKMN